MTRTRVNLLMYDPDPKNIIGQGSFGAIVFKGSLQFEQVAIKRIPIYIKSAELNESIKEEEELMKAVNGHPNILRYICTEIDDTFMYLVTELCKGTLEDYVTGKYEGPRFESEAQILHQVTQGLAHLHSLKIVHRDIKPTNILICEPLHKPFFLVMPKMKLADFGISKKLNTSEQNLTNTNVANPKGTRGWMAPELYEVERFDFKVDIWSLGCIFGFTLSGGKHPYGNDTSQRVNLIKEKRPMLMSLQDLKEPYRTDDISFKLIKYMLEMNTEGRPDVNAVLSSPFFKLYKKNFPRHLKSFGVYIVKLYREMFKTMVVVDTLLRNHFVIPFYLENPRYFVFFSLIAVITIISLFFFIVP